MARARSRFAMFTEQISRTKAEPANKAIKGVRRSRTTSRCMGATASVRFSFANSV